jgi:hypothetical protein
MTRRKDPAATRSPLGQMEAAGHALPAYEPAFEPVPRKIRRHDGWTPERQRAFIAALAESGNVNAACEHVGMTAVGAYYLRRQPGAESFRRAWEAALDGGAAPPDPRPSPAPLTLRGLMHVLEAHARRRREAAAEAGLTDEEIDALNAALIAGFSPAR